MDAVSPFLDPIESRYLYLQINNDWNRLLIELNAKTDNPPNNYSNINNCLSSSGLYSLSNSCNASAENKQYECAWRLGIQLSNVYVFLRKCF